MHSKIMWLKIEIDFKEIRSKKLYIVLFIYLFIYCKYIKVSNKMILEVGVEYDLVENHKSCSSNGTQNHG